MKYLNIGLGLFYSIGFLATGDDFLFVAGTVHYAAFFATLSIESKLCPR